MPDHIENLFAGLRADTLPQVLPPGTAAARRTVRRRRTIRLVSVATAALAVAGVVTVVGLPRMDDGEQPVAASQWVAKARAAVVERQAEDHGDVDVTVAGGQASDGTVAADGSAFFNDVNAGGYTVAVACGGPGVLTVGMTLTHDSDDLIDLGGQVVTCGTDPKAAELQFRVQRTGKLTVSLSGDAQAAGSAGYALALYLNADSGEPATVSPQARYNVGRANSLLSAGPETQQDSLTTEGDSQSTIVETKKAGEYQLRVACAGGGSVQLIVGQLELKNGTFVQHEGFVFEDTVQCVDVDPTPYPGLIDLPMPKNSAVSVTIKPDEAARNTAGLAFTLQRS
ncbi:hypothetical protein GCM10010435_56260 [Winogradskya consettensis]|uniref:Uncharacterized protein n=1 Tax=Winogradskya consettensis TaxID=113560 RepID=A0A919S928_9ACTN|nr:hypothetical protein [Actinoplanes consettensis]GIM67394.1 hypothetical protein Aco04nite_06060 [Actinoplanes consettensis]